MPIIFKSQATPSYMKITKVSNTLLPPITQNTIQIRGRAGAYDFGNTFGIREIKLEYKIVAADEADMIVKSRAIANWLYDNNAQELRMTLEPDKYYLAKITGITELEELLKTGEGSCTFICTEPFLFGEEQIITANPTNTNPINAQNNGSASTFPTISCEFKQPTTEFAIVSDNEYLYFGKPATVEGNPKPKDILVLNEEFTSITGWANGIQVDGVQAPKITGAFASDGQRFYVSDYGTGTYWHGPAKVKSLSKQVQDFSIELAVELNCSDKGQLARAEVYLLDINNVIIGKLGIGDYQASMEYAGIEARAGSYSGGTFIMETHKKTPKSYPNFIGIIRMARRGNTWTAYVARKDGKWNDYEGFTAKFIDIDNLYTAKVAAVQIHMAQYGTYPAPPNMYMHYLKVWEEDVITETDVPYIFNTGDILYVNNSTGEILKNGRPFFKDLHPSSNYIKMSPGANGISFSPAIVKNVEISYNERWLR